MNGRGTIELTGGRIIHLRWFRQHEHYAGLLEGAPSRERNDGYLRDLIEEERQRTHREPYLVPPHQEPLGHRAGRDRALLPGIACVGNFDSPSPARDLSQDYSTLSILWFQEDYAFPIEPEAIEKIRAIDWAGLASDSTY